MVAKTSLADTWFRDCTRLRREYRTSRLGFTMVELLVATVVMSFTLLGVYTVFRQSLFLEESVTSRWRDRAEASVVADYLADHFEQAIRLDSYPLIRGGPIENEPGQELLCTVSGGRPGLSNPTAAAIQRYRFAWGGNDKLEGQLDMQAIPFAGTTDLGLPEGTEDQEFSDTQRWALVPPIKIAEGIDSIQITYRPVDNPEADWKNRWASSDSLPLVRIRVRTGQYTAERFVVPKVTTPIVPGSEG